MQLYAGLDVSMDETSICIVDRDGKIKECRTATEPAAMCPLLMATRIASTALVSMPRRSHHGCSPSCVGEVAGDRGRSRPHAEGIVGPMQ